MLCLPFHVPLDVLVAALPSDRDRVQLLLTCKRLYAHRADFAIDWQIERIVSAFQEGNGALYASHLTRLCEKRLCDNNLTTASSIVQRLRWKDERIAHIVQWTIEQDSSRDTPHRLRQLLLNYVGFFLQWKPTDNLFTKFFDVEYYRAQHEFYRGVCKTLIDTSTKVANPFALEDVALYGHRALAQTDLRRHQWVENLRRHQWVESIVDAYLVPFDRRLACLAVLWTWFPCTNMAILLPLTWRGQTYEQTNLVWRSYLHTIQPACEHVYEFLRDEHPFTNVDPFRNTLDEYATQANFSTRFWFAWFLLSHRAERAADLLRGTDELPFDVFEETCTFVSNEDDLRSILSARDFRADAVNVVQLCLQVRFDVTTTVRDYLPYVSVPDLRDAFNNDGFDQKDSATVAVLADHVVTLLEEQKVPAADLYSYGVTARCHWFREAVGIYVTRHQWDRDVLQLLGTTSSATSVDEGPNVVVDAGTMCTIVYHHTKKACVAEPHHVIPILTEMYQCVPPGIPMFHVENFVGSLLNLQAIKDQYMIERAATLHLLQVIVDTYGSLKHALAMGQRFQVGRVLTVADLHSLFERQPNSEYRNNTAEQHWQWLLDYLRKTGSATAPLNDPPELPNMPSQPTLVRSTANAVATGKVQHVQTFARYINAPAYFELCFATACELAAEAYEEAIAQAFQALIECQSWHKPQRSRACLLEAAQRHHAHAALQALQQSVRMSTWCLLYH